MSSCGTSPETRAHSRKKPVHAATKEKEEKKEQKKKKEKKRKKKVLVLAGLFRKRSSQLFGTQGEHRTAVNKQER